MIGIIVLGMMSVLMAISSFGVARIMSENPRIKQYRTLFIFTLTGSMVVWLMFSIVLKLYVTQY